MSRIELWVGGMSTKKTGHHLWLVDCCVVHVQIHRERRRRLKSSANFNPPVSELEKGEIGKRGWRRVGGERGVSSDGNGKYCNNSVTAPAVDGK